MAGFEEFWLSYPRKEAKAACVKKWDQKKLDDRAAMIVAHVKKRAKDDKKWKDGFIPMPLTFLSQERWTDEYEAVQYKQPAAAAVYVPMVYPQTCHWQTAANGVLMLVLQAVGGVSPAKLEMLVAMKRKMGTRLKNLYGDQDAPADDWRRISREAYDWMLKVANGTPGETGSGESRDSEEESDAVAA